MKKGEWLFLIDNHSKFTINGLTMFLWLVIDR